MLLLNDEEDQQRLSALINDLFFVTIRYPDKLNNLSYVDIQQLGRIGFLKYFVSDFLSYSKVLL